MTAAEIAILLRLRDELSEPLKRAESAVRDMGTAVQSVGQQSRGLSSVGQQLQSVSKQFDGLSKSAGDVGKRMSLGVTAPVTAAGLAAIKAGNDFESAFAGVIKTVDASDAELAQLRDGIRAMARNEVPASAAAIAGVAEAAGQLGIQNANILEFTRVMIDLGEATNLSATDAATALARFANITGMAQTDFDRLGSVIVALGNNFATTESEIVSMGLRLAGAGAQIGLTEGQIMAFATALSSVGIEAEAGGSAFSKLWIQIAQAVATGNEDLAQFASVAGMTAQQFQQAFEQDAASAIIAFIAGLNNASMSGENLFQILEDLGITEVRMRDAVLRSAGAHQIMTDAIRLQGGAWEDNSALTTEATQRYATFASQLQMMRNRIVDVAISFFETLRPMALAAVGAISSLSERFQGLDSDTRKFIVIAAGIVAAIGPMALAISGVAAAIGFLLTPIGLVVLALAGLGVAVAAAIVYWDDLTDAFPELQQVVDDAKRALDVIIDVLGAALPGAINYVIGYLKVFAGTALTAFELVKGGALISLAVMRGELHKVPGIVKDTAAGVQRGAELMAEGYQQMGEAAIQMASDVWTAMQRVEEVSTFDRIAQITRDALSQQMAAEFAAQGVDEWANAIAGLDEQLGGVAPAIDGVTRATQANGEAIRTVTSDELFAQEAMLQTVQIAHQAKLAQDELAEAWHGLQTAVRTEIDKSRGAISEWKNSLSETEEAIGFLQQKQEEGITLSQREQEQLDILTWFQARQANGIRDDLMPAFVDAKVAEAELVRVTDEYNEAVRQGVEDLTPFEDAVKDAYQKVKDANDPTKDLRDSNNELADVVQTVLVPAIEDLTRKLEYVNKPWLVEIDVAAEAAERELQRILGLIERINSSHIAPVDSGGESGRGGTAFAEGGFIDRPTLALMGEIGRELVLPLYDQQRSMELLRQSGLLAGALWDVGGMMTSPPLDMQYMASITVNDGGGGGPQMPTPGGGVAGTSMTPRLPEQSGGVHVSPETAAINVNVSLDGDALARSFGNRLRRGQDLNVGVVQ